MKNAKNFDMRAKRAKHMKIYISILKKKMNVDCSENGVIGCKIWVKKGNVTGLNRQLISADMYGSASSDCFSSAGLAGRRLPTPGCGTGEWSYNIMHIIMRLTCESDS